MPGASESTQQNVKQGERHMRDYLDGRDPREHFTSYIKEHEVRKT